MIESVYEAIACEGEYPLWRLAKGYARCKHDHKLPFVKRVDGEKAARISCLGAF